jgi:MFS family permease
MNKAEAMMLPVGRMVLLRSVAKRDIVVATSWLVMPGLVGNMVGPPLGGLIVTYVDWRWIFWINLPIGALGIYLVGRFIPNQRERVQRPFDVAGFVLSGVSLLTLIAALEISRRGSRLLPAAGLLVAGLAGAFLYIRHARRTEHPLLDLSLLRFPTFRLAFIGGSLARITQGAQPFLLPLMLQLALLRWALLLAPSR